MIQCALRMVQTQRRGLLTLRRLLALQKLLFRQRQALLRSFLKWHYHAAHVAAEPNRWVLVETFNGQPGPDREGRANLLEHNK